MIQSAKLSLGIT